MTTLITNHTYSNLVLREPGYAGAASTPDEAIYKSLGDQMAAQNGYTSEWSYQFYETTGTTEDWSYYATGGLGFTFEHGTNSFHPAFSNVVNYYYGSGSTAGKGNRGAYLLAAESAINAARHSIITGTGPAGAVLRLKKSFNTKTWNGGGPRCERYGESHHLRYSLLTAGRFPDLQRVRDGEVTAVGLTVAGDPV